MEVTTDLRPLLGPVRDQGLRPTCMAFAASAAHEFHHGRTDPLCPEWLYYHAVTRAGDDHDAGLTTPHTIASLRRDGQPDEAAWPYCSAPPSSNWKPPAIPAELFYADADHSTVDLATIATSIDVQTPVLLTLLVDDTFMAWTTVEGEPVIEDAPPPFDDESGHAILAVGHGIIAGKSHLLIRNSWGEGWGDGGHAWISDTYCSARGFGAVVLMEI